MQRALWLRLGEDPDGMVATLPTPPFFSFVHFLVAFSRRVIGPELCRDDFKYVFRKTNQTEWDVLRVNFQ